MDVVYTYYEEDKGFEEKQAYIYNHAIKEYRGEEVTVEAIKQRNTYDAPEPYAIKYASTADGTPLAYIQYRVYKLPNFTSLWLGYPWGANCPIEIQHQLFKEMLVYLKSKYPHYPINLGYFDNRFKKMHDFATSQGFVEKYQKFHYLFDSNKLKDTSYPELPLKNATQNDLTQLVDLAERDRIIDKVYLNGIEIQDYLQQDHLSKPFDPTNLSLIFDSDNAKPSDPTNLFIVYDEDEYLAAGAIMLDQSSDHYNLSFSMCKPGHEQILRTLLVKLSQTIEDDRPLQVIARNDQDYWHTFAKELQAVIIKKRTLYVLH